MLFWVTAASTPLPLHYIFHKNHDTIAVTPFTKQVEKKLTYKKDNMS